MSARNYTQLCRNPGTSLSFKAADGGENDSYLPHLLGKAQPVGSANNDGELGSRDMVVSDEPSTVADSEAAKYAELYPGRPLLRPRIRFKNASSGEGWNEEFSKQYRFHASHSPGLFNTTMCVLETQITWDYSYV